jgi:hypothetical protein
MMSRLFDGRPRAPAAVIMTLSIVAILTAIATSQTISSSSPITATASTALVYLPIIMRGGATLGTEWIQHGANAQRTSHMTNEVPTPWRLK